MVQMIKSIMVEKAQHWECQEAGHTVPEGWKQRGINVGLSGLLPFILIQSFGLQSMGRYGHINCGSFSLSKPFGNTTQPQPELCLISVLTVS